MSKLTRTSKRLTGATLAAGLVMAVTHADADPPSVTPAGGHARISVHRNDDGTLKRGLRNEVETSNWSGYAVANWSTGDTYTGAEASWVVPTVSFQAPPPVCHIVRSRHNSQQVCSSPSVSAEYSSSWVGIGGYCENANCTAADNTLIQLGTEQDVSSKGATQYYAWIEMLPNYPILISPSYPNCNSLSCAYAVKPGDSITASLECESSCVDGEPQSWRLTMYDSTQGWNFSTVVSYASTLLSAEWIQEAPTSGGVLPLADYKTATFFPTVHDGAPNLVDPILMVDPYGETSAPSSPSPDAFSTCWGNNSNNIANCPAP